MSQASGQAMAPPPPQASSTRPAQAATGATAPATAATAPGTATTPATAATKPASGLSTPAWLARIRLLTAVTLLVAGLVGAGSALAVWRATDSAAANAEQLLRAQDIKVSMLRADALATNAFLVGGLEPADRRAAYDAAISQANRDIVDAAQAQPADRQVLEALGQAVADYTNAMTLARANNRQGFPVGAGYLNQGSTELRSAALPLVDALISANDDRARSGMTVTLWPFLLLAVTALALLTLVWVNQRLAARFRRRVNPGVALAGLAALVGLGFATVATFAQSTESSTVRTGSYAQAVAASDARSAGNDAKANEALRLVSRGSGKAYEQKWVAAAKTVTDTGVAGRQWSAYAAAHAKIVALDDGGDWDGAVAAATTAAGGSATADFTAFDDAAKAQVEARSNATTSALQGGLVVLLVAAAFGFVLCLLAAGLAWRGVSQRLEEYL